MEKTRLDVSVIVPVLNEEKNLSELKERIIKEMERLGMTFEIIFVDDGSSDSTWRMVNGMYKADRRVGGLSLNRNYGQHTAVIAGMKASAGDVVVTIDADLQNPPEEIGAIIGKLKEGYDVVGGIRTKRQDPLIRRICSFFMNRLVSMSVGVRMKDAGCMLRGYSRSVVDALVASRENIGFVPVLAAIYGSRIVEIPINHESRKRGPSKYNIFKLVKLNYDLLTGFSLFPIQMLTFLGVAVFLVGLGLCSYLLVRSFTVPVGSGLDAVYAMFAVLYLLVGLLILAVGIVGEYIGRIYMEVRNRPKYIVRESAGLKREI